ncbi:SGNH/GDSL hydrolase family protein, partial [Brevundimonas nasdae]|uniref:SGNH/GDSL hydrolase family protein n=1 Tax=Brevundimonas nasdae TaxID=172043 RepID=UPI00289EF54A
EAHTIEVRTPGNTGTVAIHGFVPRRGGSGAVLHKAGNAGAISDNLYVVRDEAAKYLPALAPDIIVLALTTNDSSVKYETSDFRAHVAALIDTWRAALPDVGIVLVCPARVIGPKNSRLIDYRDALYDIAMAKNCEFYSLYDDWADTVTMHAAGMFDDDVHPSAAGSDFIARRLFQLMGI